MTIQPKDPAMIVTEILPDELTNAKTVSRGRLVMRRFFRRRLATVGLVVVALLFLRPGPFWWALIMLASAGVFAAEMFNTAIEHLADHLHPGIHPHIRAVKDCAAAGVLIASLGAIAVAVALVVHLIKN